MNQAGDPELLSFAAEILERQGALVEPLDDRLSTLLPQNLAESLKLPEETVLGGEDAPLLYGSPLLDRLVQLATKDVPVAYGQIEVPYIKKAGFEQRIGEDISFVDGQVRVTNRAEARTTYIVLICHYVALSDERKEGLVQVGIHEGSGARIDGLAQVWQELKPVFFLPGNVPPHFPVHLEETLAAAMRRARIEAEEDLAEFFRSMERRLRRDVKSTREYYEALRKEMQANLRQASLAEQQRSEREAKIADLPAEMDRKIIDLEQKYQVQVSLTGRAAIRFLVDIAQVFVELRYRKYRRSIRLIWNPITRRLDPLVCEACRETTSRVVPIVVNSAIELRCYGCSR
ncbi:MAG: hypothetical protein WCA08_04605 [Desulfoferrobacter sp.]